ncbi:MAG: hypothetical protein GXP26_06270, partial [Planctomycetes bacterium]|nr:hypothetical protein [Planctomycetota bacterium]
MTPSNENRRQMTVGVFTACMVLMVTVCWASFAIGGETIRAGIIGCDTS